MYVYQCARPYTTPSEQVAQNYGTELPYRCDPITTGGPFPCSPRLADALHVINARSFNDSDSDTNHIVTTIIVFTVIISVLVCVGISREVIRRSRRRLAAQSSRPDTRVLAEVTLGPAGVNNVESTVDGIRPPAYAALSMGGGLAPPPPAFYSQDGQHSTITIHPMPPLRGTPSPTPPPYASSLTLPTSVSRQPAQEFRQPG
ncbi:hypothetical protein FRB99_001514 [Tulasnella sp. 403]|nr:hypothetical protein FRB99_001514 [Tulasnella sp. 403]